MNCIHCGKQMTDWDVRKYKNVCQACHNYFKNGRTVNPLPPHGQVVKDSRGYVICHICGRAYKRLGSHVRETHGMSIAEYKAEFGLCANARTTEDKYSKTMHDHALKNDMDKQLNRTGYATRVKKGDVSLRKGKDVRLQERIDRSNRMKKRGD